jgi:hypothetical protein
VDIHKLRIMLGILFVLGAIIWIIDDSKCNYWKLVNSDDFSPHCDYTKAEANSADLDDCNYLNIAYLVIGVGIIIVFH